MRWLVLTHARKLTNHINGFAIPSCLEVSRGSLLFFLQFLVGISHVVLDTICIEILGCLRPVKRLRRLKIRFLKVVAIDLQLVVTIAAQVHCKIHNKLEITFGHANKIKTVNCLQFYNVLMQY